jgi:hypothetical protein
MPPPSPEHLGRLSGMPADHSEEREMKRDFLRRLARLEARAMMKDTMRPFSITNPVRLAGKRRDQDAADGGQ